MGKLHILQCTTAIGVRMVRISLLLLATHVVLLSVDGPSCSAALMTMMMMMMMMTADP